MLFVESMVANELGINIGGERFVESKWIVNDF